MQKFLIERYVSVFRITDRVGKVVRIENRYASCFIVTLRGRIRFSFSDAIMDTCPGRGIWIPGGAAYENRCLEEADSIVFNFDAVGEGLSPCSVPAPESRMALDSMQRIEYRAAVSRDPRDFAILGELNLLAHSLLGCSQERGDKQRLAEKAYAYLVSRCGDRALRVEHAARHCAVSTVYLRKLFAETYGRSPQEVLISMRMGRAAALLRERLPVGEVARAVGYGDVYQFSRAYRRYFGHAPTQPGC